MATLHLRRHVNPVLLHAAAADGFLRTGTERRVAGEPHQRTAGGLERLSEPAYLTIHRLVAVASSTTPLIRREEFDCSQLSTPRLRMSNPNRSSGVSLAGLYRPRTCCRSDRVAPLSISADGLALLGFKPINATGAAKLYDQAQFPDMCRAMIHGLQDAADQYPLAA
ncbi:hypothetical protein [Stenotrophomonas maltophilia]|uniref:hypothetical protein n=1 Tax=Stenotrophomonas maltophilia TaxID=40324 RepID=UPI0011AEA535|nr:hypothetical protein [Stenotrophomonas maltophilia]MBH1622928.1 hypothetical protein [Stenotrophomonas maltophilia]MBN4978460.1 hypothetical protein [Stenotrophomonas maltophilia]MCF3456345.1 hypothetical protein [Stenotrophomonas maltophilia]MCF3541786.1 hypothetical protein [Stenotrophomonas maltophilia]MCU1104092.1 hypothetical protein [Stenotrophomonas maltophilia]